MYARWCGRPLCSSHQLFQINTLMNYPRSGTGVALLASLQPALLEGTSIDNEPEQKKS